jgi:hypothetical protein
VLPKKEIEPMSGEVPFRGLPISTMKGSAVAGVSLILALEAFDLYTVKTINHIPEETHDAKYPAAHH